MALLKKIENLHVGDIVKVFNHETGLFDNSPIIFITHIDDEPIYTEIIELKFDNGKTLDIATDHALLDKSINQYVIINADNAHSYLGHTFALYDIDTIGYAKLISYSINLKYVRVYCPVTAYHLNVIANNFITMPTIPYYDIYGLYNFFDLDDDMKYNPIRKAIDIDTYGLFSYEEFIKIIEIPYELFASSLPIFKN